MESNTTRMGGFCGTCYTEAIERVCAGYTITSHSGNMILAVPPLDPVMAAAVRKAARRYLEDNGQGSAKLHPHNGAMQP